MRVALGQINPTVGDFSGNAAKIIDYSRRARESGARLILFPELCLCGYPPRDLVEKPAFLERAATVLAEVAAQTRGIAVVCGYPSVSPAGVGKSALNSAALLCDGAVAMVQSKRLLPTYDVFDELRNFAPAERQCLYALGNRKLALTICEDAWNDKGFWNRRLYATDPVEELVQAGGDALLNISASPYFIGKRELRRDMLAALARRHGVPVIMCNQVGGNDSLVFDGSSLAISPQGEVIAEARSFEEDLICVDLDTMTGDLHEQLPGTEASAYAALVLGTRDYVRKCGFRKVLIGLSGGIDSALTATIAADAVGPENVTGIGMPGPFSSPGSINDARDLAANLGIRFELIGIGGPFQAYLDTLQPLFAGHGSDVAEENLQARIRGNLLMALSNKFGALVLSTGNKSEIAVGYCTLYGDMAGGLAVISDVPKTMVYRLSHYANSQRQRIPTASLEKPPSAELRPDQKDQDSLPPYEVLDPILEDYIEDNRTAEEIATGRHFDLALVQSVIRMVERAEYKRQQAAPGLKVTQKAFGVGRRFPIAARYEV